MPTVDERLAQLLGDAAVTPPIDDDVFGAVAHKRQQRRTRRVARNVGALVALLVVLAGSLVWLTTDDGTEPAVAPASRNSVQSRKLGDAWLGARPVEIAPDMGYVRGPLLQSGEYVALSTYDRNGNGFKMPPPSRLVRIDETGHVVDEVDLQGEILSLSDGEGARWVVTHDGDNVAPRLYRVKRIGADGKPVSNQFPPGDVPTGPIVAGGGAAWVPVNDGVLRFDAVTGAYTGEVALPGWQLPRLVAAGGEVYAYSSPFSSKGGSGLLELVPLTGATTTAPEAVRIAEPVVSIAETQRGLWALVWDGSRSVVAPLDPASGRIDRTRAVQLPRGFTGSELQGTGSRLWVGGAFSDARSGIVRMSVRDDGHASASRPVLLRAPNQSGLLGLDGNDVLVAADGRLYRVHVGS